MLCRALPRLVRHTVRCPCGRRVSHPAVLEGQAAPSLACDAECKRQQRQRRLADAFGVADPETHASVFDRNR